MEFETKTDKIAFMIIIPVALIAIGTLFYKMHETDVRYEEKHQAEKAACDSLNVKFGQSVHVKKAFTKT